MTKPLSGRPNAAKWTYPETRRSAIHARIIGAISPEHCMYLLEELMSLEPKDKKQLRKTMHDLFSSELLILQHRLGEIRNCIYEIQYERSDKGIANRMARAKKHEALVAARKKEDPNRN